MNNPLIGPDWVRLMARYNAWQNRWLMPAILSLPPGEAERDRGAFFGSIRKTVSHLLWADEIWLSRFVGAARDGGGIAGSVDWAADIEDWAARRPGVDADIVAWAQDLTDCAGDLTWHSPMLGRQVSKPKGLLFTHFFNHQTHHRGQVHAMLTALGIETGASDVAFMPEDA
ncbi:DinB family protein [Jannaschia aquimarina]|uniref:DinB family protein n=1 Tax=Jannaschia aquimarina TaxID=935700 RepID=A0A0D1CMF3_9RHOB|nr:DinB family protein [Jannaschia aquimarina]KIT15957.1 DinB family protein [Jannaschia aquimarina]SNS98668.1 Uncharacterized damage-inducible protein DinB (forms a four-helix bundle) [Jannaschia aquimarina]